MENKSWKTKQMENNNFTGFIDTCVGASVHTKVKKNRKIAGAAISREARINCPLKESWEVLVASQNREFLM